MTPRELLAWDMYFAGLVSIRFHPGSGRTIITADKEFLQAVTRSCGEVADYMMFERRRRDPEVYARVKSGDTPSLRDAP